MASFEGSFVKQEPLLLSVVSAPPASEAMTSSVGIFLMFSLKKKQYPLNCLAADRSYFLGFHRQHRNSLFAWVSLFDLVLMQALRLDVKFSNLRSRNQQAIQPTVAGVPSLFAGQLRI
mmetsp:Transcript_51451/g.134366  ORF Transcript_51451/g.134366 Transcript_51451/m.134366 type:complete len:118 (-) Transcript_51451:36-389(-)